MKWKVEKTITLTRFVGAVSLSKVNSLRLRST